MSVSYVDLGNDALVKLGHEEFITSLTQNTKAARLINQCHQLVKKSVLRAHSWNFAKKRIQLAALPDAPVFGGRAYFPYPSDWLRTLRDKDNIYDEFDVEGPGIRAYGTSFDLLYIFNVDDPSKFDSMFNQAYSSAIAERICIGLTGDRKLRDTMRSMYNDDLSLARSINAQEQGLQTISADIFVSERF